MRENSVLVLWLESSFNYGMTFLNRNDGIESDKFDFALL